METIPKKPSHKGPAGTIRKFTEIPDFLNVSVNQKRARVISVLSNHYNVSFTKGRIYQWSAKFDPKLPEDSRDKISEIIEANRAKIHSILGMFVVVSNTIFTFKKWDGYGTMNKFKLKKHPEFHLKLKLAKYFDFDNIYNLGIDSFEVIRVINFQINCIMRKLKYSSFGNDGIYYDKQGYKKLEIMNGNFLLRIMSGFKATIDVYNNSIPKMLVDCNTRILRDYDAWQEFTWLVEQEMSNGVGKKIAIDMVVDNYIVGKTFIRNYGNQRHVRIDQVAFDLNPLSPFENEDFENYKEYFESRYKGVKVGDLNQFLYVSNTYRKQRNKEGKVVKVQVTEFFIPELLLPSGMTDEMKRDNTCMRKIANYTQINPQNRMARQERLVEQINQTKNENSIKLEVKLDTNQIDDALLFKPPQIYTQEAFIPKGSGNFKLDKPIFDQNFSLRKWGIIYLDHPNDAQKAEYVAEKIGFISTEIGVEVCQPLLFPVSNEKNSQLSDNIMKIIFSTLKKNPQIFLLMLPKRVSNKVYKVIKNECNSKLGIATQFFVAWTNKKLFGNLSLYKSLLAQMAAKLGCTLWRVELPYNLNKNGRKTMIIGADVFHMNGRESVTSVVATMDKHFSETFSINSIQKRQGDDILHSVTEQVIKCVKQYTVKNNHSPDLIVFFRDGIGRGSYDYVKSEEIAPILEKLSSGQFTGTQNNSPKLAYIVVSKRVNDRFYLQDGPSRVSNPNGGLLIKSKVTNNQGFDYFMVSQKVTMGTATPTHYECLHNDTGLSADTFYELTYYQSFNYFNWPGPVKVPAVVQYATKQAYLTGYTQPKSKRKKNHQEEQMSDDDVNVEHLEAMRSTKYFL